MSHQMDLIYRAPPTAEDELHIPEWLYEEKDDPLTPEWLFHESKESPHFDSYNKYLKENYSHFYRRNPNIPPNHIEPRVMPGYRDWMNLSAAARAEHPLNQVIQTGQFAIYGRHLTQSGTEQPQLQPVHGPLPFDVMYEEPKDYGRDFQQPFDDNQKFRALMGRFGYQILFNVTKGEDSDPFDHQIWVVGKIGTYDRYAMKVVAARYFYRTVMEPMRTSKAINQMEKESEVMKLMNHPNIVRVLEVIGIRDTYTNFSYVFIGTVMELMSGSTMTLTLDYKDPNREFKVPEWLAAEIMMQTIKAVDYLHNRMDNYVISHQAIRPANILFTERPGQDPRSRFKLTDFEECIVYDRSRQRPGVPIDRLPNPNVPVYINHCSSPEYWDVTEGHEYADPRTIRTMPNDIYSVAASICFLMEGYDKNDEETDFSRERIQLLQSRRHWPNPFHELLRLMSIFRAQQRISAYDLVNHPLFKQIDAMQELDFVVKEHDQFDDESDDL